MDFVYKVTGQDKIEVPQERTKILVLCRFLHSTGHYYCVAGLGGAMAVTERLSGRV